MDTAAAECERQADGQRVETEGERERREERGRHENMQGSERATQEPVKNAAFCFSMRCSDNTYEIGMS